MKKIKILYVLPTLDFSGGIESYTMNYFLNFSDNFTADFIVHEYQYTYYKNVIETHGGNVYFMPKIDFKSISNYIRELKKFFKEHHDYDIIHCNIINESLFYFNEARKYNIPVRINHSHQNAYGDRLNRIIRNYPLIKIGSKKSNVNFACSKLAGDFLYGKKKYYIINNAIDIDRFKYNKKSREEIRKEFSISDDTFLIGNVARLAPQKNQLFLLDVMNEIVKKEKKSKLMIIGDGPLYIPIEQKINELGLKDNVILLNGRKDIDKYYSAFDCFVLPSIYEGLGIVNIEAQVSGLNLIVSDKVPITAKITDNIKFLDLNLGKDKWANEILKVKNKTRNKITDSIYDSGYDIKKEIKKLENLYIELLKQNSHRS